MKENYKKWWFPLFVSILLSVLFHYCFVSRAIVDLDLHVSKTTWFKIYWSREGQLFSEKRMARVRVRPNSTHYSFFLTDLRGVDKLRIDTHQYPGEAVLSKLVLRQYGFQPIVFEHKNDFSRLRKFFEINETRLSPDGLVVKSTGSDPQFLYLLQLQPGRSFYLDEIASIFFIFLSIFIFFFLPSIYACRTSIFPVFL